MARQSTTGKSPISGRRVQRRDDTPPAPQTRKQIAHGKRQARQQRIIALVLIVLGTLILGIIAAAFVNVAVVGPRKPVARVNDTTIRMSDYVALTNVRRSNLQSTISRYQSEISSLDTTDETNSFLIQYYQSLVDQLNTELLDVESSSLDELIDDSLIAEKAAEVGIRVTPVDIEESIAADLDSAFADATSTITSTDALTGTEATPTPTPVPQSAKDDYYKSVLESMNVSDKAFRAIVGRGLLRSQVQELLASQVVTTGLVAHIQLIQTDTEEKAAAAEERVKGGEDWSVVATEVTSDTLTSDAGGDIPVTTPDLVTSRYGQEVESLVFSLEAGAIGRAVSNGKYYVVRLVDRDDNGALPQDVVSSKRSSALRDWLEERKASPEVRIERLIEPSPTE